MYFLLICFVKCKIDNVNNYSARIRFYTLSLTRMYCYGILTYLAGNVRISSGFRDFIRRSTHSSLISCFLLPQKFPQHFSSSVSRHLMRESGNRELCISTGQLLKPQANVQRNGYQTHYPVCKCHKKLNRS